MDFAIEFDEYTKQYGSSVVVDGLSFQVNRGSVVGLLGPNGAGKSTAMRGLVGLSHPTSGAARIFGEEFARLSEPASVVGVHMDGFGFETGISARRHLEICRLAAGVSKARVGAVLEEVGLREHARKRVKQYSTGMVQRLGLAVALLAEPKILILDEPANGLDPEGIRWLRKFIRSYAERGGTVLVSSHQLRELEQIVDEVVVMNKRLLYSGALANLLGKKDASLEDRYFDLVDSSIAGS
ncbi:ABC transporter ATP-binding protein [Rathayibacter iranicus]|uniref:ABC transporter ATP-binding protein n=1 Tax=Rathayibacter iranicus TaxID=59737 RepID=A0AAD2PTR0_9MICO|nr:ATP-binding cassette domain-containing protein [Rathayibacter iranicus]AZZ54483.1 ABC transporter ATP-binding protein [Rathayibacter iranicus]MWV29906.1 ATP-binding cassette domain-containing protein [Rathayibacter iranicus NCPPB 2253 = VKM Ac-1602]PPI51658.1 ABC transporter ATP-binding protein [Rathayibacter iranicus]PPI63826.1 ABC transporter ATP-binding protein [Rathayibacter iranicus]PPI74672.1 ABC transporter ATP-binding protein [Rathayibacter iranicus]